MMHLINREVCAKIKHAIRLHKDLLTIVKRHKLKWYGHVSRSSGLAKTILQGMANGRRRRTKKKKKRWDDNMDRPGVCQVPEDSEELRQMEETGCEVICEAPVTPVVKGR